MLDLGSGGGIDVLLSARRVAPDGIAYGLDMTPEKVELANANKVSAGIKNVQFLLRTMEDIPLPDNSVDVINSNCVVNLSPTRTRSSEKHSASFAPADGSRSPTSSCPGR